jgi:hypothetical protein
MSFSLSAGSCGILSRGAPANVKNANALSALDSGRDGRDLKAASHARSARREAMCRNIRTLFNFEPPATEEEIRSSALQFVRKLSGFTAPSKANQAAFDHAVEEVSDAARRLLKSLETAASPRDREIEAIKARERSKARFA